MKAKELITELQKLDPDLPVVTHTGPYCWEAVTMVLSFLLFERESQQDIRVVSISTIQPEGEESGDDY